MIGIDAKYNQTRCHRFAVAAAAELTVIASQPKPQLEIIGDCASATSILQTPIHRIWRWQALRICSTRRLSLRSYRSAEKRSSKVGHLLHAHARNWARGTEILFEFLSAIRIYCCRCGWI